MHLFMQQKGQQNRGRGHRRQLPPQIFGRISSKKPVPPKDRITGITVYPPDFQTFRRHLTLKKVLSYPLHVDIDSSHIYFKQVNYDVGI